MQLSYYISAETNPYHNIALEEYLLKHTAEDECILYLWQNQRTVVIGYNQNLWRECKAEQLVQDGGFVARRLSGGGAVFHDMGNLNFTFLVRKGQYSLARQTEVILQAVRSFGIPAERAGRNDLLVDGKKFSGNAFYQTGDFCYHHGTILLNADTALMAKYLNPSVAKLQSKAVQSVKSRVCNLAEYHADITVDTMKTALIAAFGAVYGAEVQPFAQSRIDAAAIAAAAETFGSWDWLYGRKIPFNAQWQCRYDWGEISLQFVVSAGVIEDVAIWTDALDNTLAARLSQALRGVPFQTAAMQQALGEYAYLMEESLCDGIEP